MSSGIAVPDLPSTSDVVGLPVPLATVAYVAAIVGAIAFGAIVLWHTTRGWRTGRSKPWTAALVALAVMVLGGAGAILDVQLRSTHHAQAMDRYWAAAADARRTVEAELSQRYGVTWVQGSALPTHDGDWTAVVLRLPDGAESDCFLVVTGQEYELRCGGSDPDSATPLPLVGR